MRLGRVVTVRDISVIFGAHVSVRFVLLWTCIAGCILTPFCWRRGKVGLPLKLISDFCLA